MIEAMKAKKEAKVAKNIGYSVISGNMFDVNKTTSGFLLNANSSGAFVSTSSNFLLSTWINAKSNLKYIWTVPCNFGFYDIDKVFISGQNSLIANTEVTAPANTAYVRFSIDTSVAGRKDSCVLYSSGAYVWNSLGDSITENGHLQSFVKRDIPFRTIRNYGVGGTRLADSTGSDTTAMVNRYTSMDNSADIVTVMGGTNDWGQDVVISNAGTHDKTTFKGAMRVLIEGLIVKYPAKHIVWATPPQRKGNVTYPTGINANGNTIADFAKAVKEVCAEYAIPCVDVHNESGINQFNMDTNGSYMPDGVHPSNAGYQRIAALYLDMFRKVIY